MAPGVRTARRLDLESLGFERTPGPQSAGQGGSRGALEIGDGLRAPGGAFSTPEAGGPMASRGATAVRSPMGAVMCN